MKNTSIAIALSAVLLASCGTDESVHSDTQDQQAQEQGSEESGAQAPAGSSAGAPQLEGMVGAEQAPEGYTSEDFYGLFGGDDPGEKPQVAPEQCAPLAFDASTFMAWGAVPQDQAKVVMYTKEDSSTLSIRVSNEPVNATVDGCENFSRTGTSEIIKSETTFSSKPLELPVKNADSVVSAEQIVVGVSMDGQPIDNGKVGEKKTMIFAEVAGKTVTAVGTGNTTADEVVQLANRQIELLK